MRHRRSSMPTNIDTRVESHHLCMCVCAVDVDARSQSNFLSFLYAYDREVFTIALTVPTCPLELEFFSQLGAWPLSERTAPTAPTAPFISHSPPFLIAIPLQFRNSFSFIYSLCLLLTGNYLFLHMHATRLP